MQGVVSNLNRNGAVRGEKHSEAQDTNIYKKIEMKRSIEFEFTL